ncbi:MAG: DUF3581 domain-containing protein [Candidatus Marinimicrobia bacterium]|nr:DUF3581 domain-containing protein [Candidatus Neomarinimicrobiota bacterium]
MFLNRFYSEKNGVVQISAQQASSFAKDISGDFNSIHDPGNKSYCVPGDLLFALVLDKYGLSRKMRFIFSGMVRDGTDLLFPDLPGDQFAITDRKDKSYLQVERNGETSLNAYLIEKLTRNYVAFSGQNFPHILVPLMAEHQVMINPARPLVIYDSMSFALDHLTVTEPRLDLTETTLEIIGKRAEARLYFQIHENDQQIGTGFKKLILSGLRPYEEATIQELSEIYLARRDAYRSAP